MTNQNGHFRNLPKRGTTVALLDRQGNKSFDSLVVSRVKRNGKLRLAFVNGSGRVAYVVAVPNASNWAVDKTIRFRWAYNGITRPNIAAEDNTFSKSGTQSGRINSRTRKVGQVHPIPANGSISPRALA